MSSERQWHSKTQFENQNEKQSEMTEMKSIEGDIKKEEEAQ